jgi:hypothetical protein
MGLEILLCWRKMLLKFVINQGKYPVSPYRTRYHFSKPLEGLNNRVRG